jgi:hypothetical protein
LIAESTVFVLGAGASAAYGFPQGAGLASEICRLLQKRNIDFGRRISAHCSGRGLSLVDDDIPEERIKTAREWLQSARSVCFLGFGYHPLNMARLDAGLLDCVVRGTCLGMEDGEIRKVTRGFPKLTHLQSNFLLPYDILTFLRKTDFIHG